MLASLLDRSEARVREQLRDWYREASHKSGAKRGTKRRTLVVATCFAPLLRWVVAWSRPHVSSPRPRAGRVHPGPAFHPPGHQCGGARVCDSCRLACGGGHTPWGLAPALGRLVTPLTRQCPARLDRHCPRRSWAVRPLALYNDSELGMASLLAYQSPGAVSPAGRADLSPADAGDQPHRPAVGGSCYLLCNRCSPTAVHPPGALGPWLPRTLACGDRPPCMRPMWLGRTGAWIDVVSKTANGVGGIGSRPRRSTRPGPSASG